MQRGTFTALTGLILFIILISITYTVLANVDAQKMFGTIKTAGEVKRTFNKVRYLADRAAGDSMADTVMANYTSTGNCQSDWDYSSGINTTLDAVVQEVKNDSGIDCAFSQVSAVSSNTPFDVRLTCALSVAKGGEFWYAVSTADTFTLQKNVNITYDDLLPLCSVQIVDGHSGLNEFQKSS